jgi:hypothetical protein
MCPPRQDSQFRQRRARLGFLPPKSVQLGAHIFAASPFSTFDFRLARSAENFKCVWLGLGGVPFLALGMYSLLDPEGKTESVAPFTHLCGGISVGIAGEYEKGALG